MKSINHISLLNKMLKKDLNGEIYLGLLSLFNSYIPNFTQVIFIRRMK